DPYRTVHPWPGGAWLVPALKLWRRVGWALWLWRVLRARRPRVLYVNTFRGATAALVGRLTGSPVVWHLRGLETGTGNPLFRALRIRCIRLCATRVVAVSVATA